MDSVTLEMLTANMNQIAADRLEQLKTDISNNIDEQGKRASGRTQESLLVDNQGDKVLLWARKFIGSLETGSAPWSGKTGNPCSASRFRSIIAEWIIQKGIDVDDIGRASYLIARKIMTEGSRMWRGKMVDDVYSTAAKQAVEDIRDKAGKHILEIVNAETFKWIHNIGGHS